MRWGDLGAALALVLVIEGLIPFASPGLARRSGAALAALDDAMLRIVGALSVGLGLLTLWLVRG